MLLEQQMPSTRNCTECDSRERHELVQQSIESQLCTLCDQGGRPRLQLKLLYMSFARRPIRLPVAMCQHTRLRLWRAVLRVELERSNRSHQTVLLCFQSLQKRVLFSNCPVREPEPLDYESPSVKETSRYLTMGHGGSVSCGARHNSRLRLTLLYRELESRNRGVALGSVSMNGSFARDTKLRCYRLQVLAEIVVWHRRQRREALNVLADGRGHRRIEALHSCRRHLIRQHPVPRKRRGITEYQLDVQYLCRAGELTHRPRRCHPRLLITDAEEDPVETLCSGVSLEVCSEAKKSVASSRSETCR